MPTREERLQLLHEMWEKVSQAAEVSPATEAERLRHERRAEERESALTPEPTSNGQGELDWDL